RANIAYDTIKESIESGRIPQGKQLVESELCTILNMSRTPIREALNRLHAEGYLKYTPGRGFSTVVYSVEEIEQIYEMTEAVEGMLAYLLAKDHGDLTKLRKTVEDMEAALKKEDWDSWVNADTGFHIEMYAMCKNVYLTRDLEILNRPAHQIRMMITRFYVDKSVSTKAHRSVFDAIACGNADLARTEAQKHFSWIRERVIECLQSFEIL
ncbi:MAG: GntR family transcriptional regulator, partial [Roseburia sp.]|nr:GntR family transcriptional regulator [Roseburia sp.]